MNQKIIKVLIVSLYLFLVQAVSAKDLRIEGSDLLRGIIEDPIRKVAKASHQTVKIDLNGSDLALQSLKKGSIDLAIIALPMDKAAPAGEFESILFAHKVVLIAVNGTNPLDEISMNQLVSLYGARETVSITHWGELGLGDAWKSRKIATNAISNKSDIALELFKYTALGESALRASVTLWDDTRVIGEYLNEDASAIAVLPLITLEDGVKALSISQGDKAYAFGPTLDNVFFGDYPLRLPFYMVFKKDNKNAIKEYMKALNTDDMAKRYMKAMVMPLSPKMRNQLTLDLDTL